MVEVMSRTVNAAVVLAALDRIDEVLSDRAILQATRLSVARRRVVTLRREIENQASDPNHTDRSTTP